MYKLIFEGETDLDNEFLDLTRDQANTQYQELSLSSPCTINDLYLAHMWFIDGQNVMYIGHLNSVKTDLRKEYNSKSDCYLLEG